MATETTATPKPEKKMASVLDQLKELDKKRAELLSNATAELKKKAEDAISELNALGFNYRLVEDDQKPSKGKGGGAGKPRQKKDCTICKFGTEPHHDGRHPAHRDQGENKKPFTASQLKELGLEKKTSA
jgi:uncharacterized protein YfaQ (DUF2300 family)